MDKNDISKIMKSVLPHIVAVVLFLLISYVYFSPQLEGKRLKSGDVDHFRGASKELLDYREANNEEGLWTNSLFGGMPAYLISVKVTTNVYLYITKMIQIGSRPASYLFVCLLGFYIALLLFGVNPWLSMAGAIAYAFSSYFFIILSAGHMTKAVALTYMPAVIAGVYHTYNKKMWLGLAVTGLFLGLQLKASHPQITYYTGIVIIILILTELYKTIKKKDWMVYLKKSALLAAIAVLALGTDITSLWMTYEYGEHSIRGESELSDHSGNKTAGLDKEYITAWSYGVDETLTLLVPNAMGGSSHGSLDESSETYELLEPMYGKRTKSIIKHLPLYFGDQPFTSGPVYFGAVVMLLFVFGMFLLRGPLKWWLLIATVLSLMLSWGHNFMFFTDLFIDYFPGYNKFRTVSMTLVIAQVTVPLLGILAIKQLMSQKYEKTKLINALKYSLIITGGIALLLAIFPGIMGDFSAAGDKQTLGNPDLIRAIEQDRESLVRSDAFRSLIFILLTSGLLWAFVTEKLKRNYFFIGLGILFIADMWPVNKRFINNDNFTRARKVEKPYTPNQADKQIMQDNGYYRVFNTTARLDQDSRTSYFHKSLGGYHGAKMQRYQEIIEYHLTQGNMDVINMLNTKYFISSNKQNKPVAQRNPGALGNAWFVNKVKMVPDADAEIKALNNFDPSTEAIVDDRFEKNVKTSYTKDSIANISLEEYGLKKMIYKAKTSTKQLAVFSEIYYPKGWKAFIDGKEVPHVRVNYILRGLEIPKGEHTIIFKFEPASYYVGQKISLASSIIMVLFMLGVFVMEGKKYFEQKES